MEAAEVRKIAHLARLGISEADIEGYARDLSAILHLVAQMDRVDTKGVEPLAHPLNMVQRLRPDEVTEADQRQRLQASAPLTEDGLYLVPRVVE
jgi:aspartyl-tRNA(Asn)/glutamyl-tRNA(Gln) amidotransferase subunit C